MTACSKELISLLNTLTISEKYVKVFHIFENHKPSNSTEPKQTNRTKMV